MNLYQYDTNLLDYGWYEVGPQKYTNKLEALWAHEKLKLPIRWNFNDDVYDQYRWDQEPPEPLENLYAERAWQIRTKYDYLVLHFSGGSDSANILEIFIKNKIPLDEIITRGPYQHARRGQGPQASTDQYAECLDQAFPLAQWVKDHHYPHLKISVIETTDLTINYFKQNHDWTETSAGLLTPTGYFKSNLDVLSPHYQQMIEKGTKVAHILGYEKPTIFRKDGYFYTRWSDSFIREFSRYKSHNYQHPMFVELFYWGKNAAKIQLKQLHMIKNFIKQHNMPDEAFTEKGRSTDNFKANIIYNRTLPLLTEHEKFTRVSKAVWDPDLWFVKKNSDAFQNWRKSAEHVVSLVPKAWRRGEGFWDFGIKQLESKPRFLGY